MHVLSSSTFEFLRFGLGVFLLLGAVLTVQTFTKVCTFDIPLEALTVLLQTMRLLTVAASAMVLLITYFALFFIHLDLWLESCRVSLKNLRSGRLTFLFIGCSVPASLTSTVRRTGGAISKTLTVELQTFGLSAVTALA